MAAGKDGTKTMSPHKSDKATTVTCVAAKSLPAGGGGFVLSGSSDKNAILSSIETGKVSQSYSYGLIVSERK